MGTTSWYGHYTSERQRHFRVQRGEDVERVGGPAGGHDQDCSKVSCKKPCSKISSLVLRDVNPRLRPVGCSLRVATTTTTKATAATPKTGQPLRPRPRPRPRQGNKHLNECKWLSCEHFLLLSTSAWNCRDWIRAHPGAAGVSA
jgi:hypothetical protein